MSILALKPFSSIRLCKELRFEVSVRFSGINNHTHPLILGSTYSFT